MKLLATLSIIILFSFTLVGSGLFSEAYANDDSAQQNYGIPSWIKNNAGWWAEGIIDDNSFIQGIQFLISNEIIQIPPTETLGSSESQGVPSWIKNNAGWWAEGIIDDNSFIQGIQWLVSNGIIILDQQESVPTKSLGSIGDQQESVPTKSLGSIGDQQESVPTKSLGSIGDQADYTVLVYIVGSDLETEYYSATDDLNEMIAVDLPSSVNVIVETGGSDAKPDEKRFLDFTTVQRLYIEHEDPVILSDLGSKNMGDPSTLSDFLVWGTQEFPAKKYVLILWDHGAGIGGFGNDEMYNYDNTTLDEFAQALDYAYSKTGITFEVIGFDQCFMAAVEVASTIENYANYMVASEEWEPGHGWDYTAILTSLKNNPNQDGKSLGKAIVDSYVKHTKDFDNKYGTDSQRGITLSVVDLAKIDSLNYALTELQDSLEQSFTLSDQNYYSFGKSLLNSERYGQQANQPDSGHTDIKDVVTNIASYLPHIKSEADNVSALVSDAVVYNVKGESKPNANGLSTYIPLTDIHHKIATTGYQQFDDVSEVYQNHLADDTDKPLLEYEVIDGKIHGQFEGDDIYSFNLFITSLDLVMEEDSTEILAIKEYNPNDFPNGDFMIDWDGYLPALCDEFDCVPINSEFFYDDHITLEYIPALLEGPDVKAEVDLIYDVSDWDNPIFLGALPYNEEDESIVERELWPLYPGDKIYTYTADYNFNTGESMQYHSYDPIIVDDYFFNTSGLMESEFDGTFELIVEVCDFSNNCVTTEPIGPYIPVAPLED